MSRKANPVTIGIFVSAGIFLLAATLVFFGALGFLRENKQAILFFEESVNGLDIGSPVKFKGVPVGRVKHILIHAKNQREDSDAIPVIVEFDQDRVEEELNVGLDMDSAAAFDREVRERGLRGRLEMQSFITGLLYVELDYLPNTPRDLHQARVVYWEIPTVESQLAEVMENATKAVANIGTIDFKALAIDVRNLLATVQERTEQLNVQELNAAVTGAAESLRALVSSEEVSRMLNDSERAVAQIADLAEQLNKDASALTPELAETLTAARKALAQIEAVAGLAGESLAPDSSLRYRLNTTLEEIGRTIRAVGRLADYLERNPEALLRGRSEGEGLQ
jgi:paraquat-inducible protein B